MKRWQWVLAGVGVLLIPALVFGIRWLVADPVGRLEAREQTVGSGSFRLGAYDYFFDLCSSIAGMEGQIAALEQEEEGSERRKEQVAASITGIKAQRARSIARYNADAQKDYTIGQFRDAGLPYRLEQEGETICGG